MEFFGFQSILQQVRLSELTVESLCSVLTLIEDLKSTSERLGLLLQQNAINGRVLMHCDLMELKSVRRHEYTETHRHVTFNVFVLQILELNFGHWEIFRLLITGLREVEKFYKYADPMAGGDSMDSYTMIPSGNMPRQKTTMEKQVSVYYI